MRIACKCLAALKANLQRRDKPTTKATLVSPSPAFLDADEAMKLKGNKLINMPEKKKMRANNSELVKKNNFHPCFLVSTER